MTNNIEPVSKLFKLAKEGENFFLSGGAGVGKTYEVNLFLKEVEEYNSDIEKRILEGEKGLKPFRVARLATTGIASTHINGQTLDSFFFLKGAHKPSMIGRVDWNKCFDNIDYYDCFITDEISMKRRDKFELIVAIFKKYYATKIDKIRHDIFMLQSGFYENVPVKERNKLAVEWEAKIPKLEEIMKPPFTFGWKSIGFVGDFLQIPPVVKKNEQYEKVKGLDKYMKFNPWAFKSLLWEECNFHNILLTEIKRQDNVDFAKALNFVRTGKLTLKAEKLLKKRNFKEYEDILKVLEKEGKEIPPVLCPTNSMISTYNHNMLEKLDAPLSSFKASFTFNSLLEEDQNKDLIFACLADTLMEKEVFLKIGCRVMFLVNDPDDKFKNGTVGTLRRIGIAFDGSATKYQLLNEFFDERAIKYEYCSGHYFINESEEVMKKLRMEFVHFFEDRRHEMETPQGRQPLKFRYETVYKTDEQGEIIEKNGVEQIDDYKYHFGSRSLLIDLDLTVDDEVNKVVKKRSVVVGRFPYPYSQKRANDVRKEKGLPLETKFEADITLNQFPVKLAYSMTFHKSQGMTMKSVIIDFRSKYIGDGSAYVALSRVEDIENLYLIGFSKNKIKASGDAIAFYRSLEKSVEQEKQIIADRERVLREAEEAEQKLLDEISDEIPWNDKEFEEKFPDENKMLKDCNEGKTFDLTEEENHERITN
jgi:hypothetical protein